MFDCVLNIFQTPVSSPMLKRITLSSLSLKKCISKKGEGLRRLKEKVESSPPLHVFMLACYVQLLTSPFCCRLWEIRELERTQILCQRLAMVNTISATGLGNGLAIQKETLSPATEMPLKVTKRESSMFGQVPSPSWGLTPQAGRASGRMKGWGKPVINQLCLY